MIQLLQIRLQKHSLPAKGYALTLKNLTYLSLVGSYVIIKLLFNAKAMTGLLVVIVDQNLQLLLSGRVKHAAAAKVTMSQYDHVDQPTAGVELEMVVDKILLTYEFLLS